MELIDELLKDLAPYMDKVFICPLLSNKIIEIENILNRELPKYYKYFLERVGLKQDFVWGFHQKINRFKDVSDFISSKDYFQFGDNGGEDYWLLKFNVENERVVYEYDYYLNGEILEIGKTFDSLLIDAFENVKKNYQEMDFNARKNWEVQFSIGTGSGKFLEKELGRFLEIKLIAEPQKILSETGEKEYENGIIEIEGKRVELKKWTYNGSSLSFNWSEPVEEIKVNSSTDRIDAALSKCLFKHTMIEYGIQSMDHS